MRKPGELTWVRSNIIICILCIMLTCSLKITKFLTFKVSYFLGILPHPFEGCWQTRDNLEKVKSRDLKTGLNYSLWTQFTMKVD